MAQPKPVFYGTGDDAAEELGGTFVMQGGISDYYYGYFGAFKEHPDVDYSFDGVVSIAVNGTDRATPFSSLAVSASLDVEIEKAEMNTDAWLNDALLSDLTLNIGMMDDDPMPTLETLAITSPQMTLTYGDDDLTQAEVSFYDGTSNQSYRLDEGTTSTPLLLKGTFDDDDRFITGSLEASRGSATSSVFGFESNYMAAARWYLISNSGTGDDIDANTAFEDADTSANIRQTTGFMIAGFETGDRYNIASRGLNFTETVMPTTGTIITFTGKGAGNFVDKSGLSDGDMFANIYYHTEFDVAASVDFDARMVDIEADNTMIYSCTKITATCSGTKTSNTDLDFSVTGLTYQSGQNNVTGALEIVGNHAMTGNISARFYGAVTEEFGGTFQLSTDDKYYMGYFGARYFVDSIADLSMLSVAGVARKVETPSLAVSAKITADFTRPQADADASASWLYDTTLADVTFANTTLAKTAFTTPKIAITYGSDGLLDEALVTFNDGTDNISYMLDKDDDGDNGVSTTILRQGLLADNTGFDVGYMAVSRGQEFGFEAEYMVATRWHLTSNIDDESATTQNSCRTHKRFYDSRV